VVQGLFQQPASRLFQEILLVRPDHTDALYLLGVIAYQTSRPVQAVKLLRRALAIGPEQAAPQRWVHKPIRNYCVVDLTALLDRARVAAGFGPFRRITGSACILSRRASRILVLGQSPPSRYLVISEVTRTSELSIKI
jgi:Tetratricopeptide repeat